VRRVLFLAASILATCPVDAGAEWRFFHTEHFQLIGDVSASQLRDVALRFEQFRDIATRLNLAPASQQATAPLTILVFRSRKSFEPYMPRDADGRIVESAGMFVEGPDSVYIAVRLDRGEESFRSVFHEYSHFLLRGVVPNAPLWLNEGMAEFYSTLRITGARSALIGYPVAAHVKLLQHQSMPLTQMFGATDRSWEYVGGQATRLLLYAQSWAVIHHAFQSSRSKEVLELARKLAAGAEVEAAVQSTYGMSIAELERRVLGYIRNGTYRALAVDFSADLVNGVTDEAVPLSDSEADGWLGDLLAQMRRDGEATLLLENALSREPGVLQAHRALALIFLRTNRKADADAHLRQMSALGIDIEEILTRSRSFAPPGGFRQLPSTRPSTPLPPGARLFLRIALPDERRSFGMLESLDCRGEQVEFVVRTTEGTVRAGGRFGEVRVITYREETLGDLRCGPQSGSLPVVVTWKPGDGDARRAIAAEFVPDDYVP